MIDLGSPLIADQGLCILESPDRFKHLFLLGSTGTGKTIFFLNLIKQEINNGIIILDPKGDLAELSASLVDKDRLIYVDKKHPLSLNPLSRKYLSKTENANELTQIINASAQEYNPDQFGVSVKMGRILRNAIQVIEDDIDLKYLSNFLDSSAIRSSYFKEQLRPLFWKEFDKSGMQSQQTRMSAERITDRLSLLFEDENLKPFTSGENEFNIPKIVEEKKVVIFNLSNFDDEATAFVGCLVANQIKSYYQHQASRKSSPLFFFCDEFQMFITKNFDRFLTQARSFNISCSFSGHDLKLVDKKLASLVLASHTVVCLGCGVDDSEIVSKRIGVNQSEIMNLKEHEAYLAIGKNPHKIMCFPPPDIEPYYPPEIPEELEVNFLRDQWIFFDVV